MGLCSWLSEFSFSSLESFQSSSSDANSDCDGNTILTVGVRGVGWGGESGVDWGDACIGVVDGTWGVLFVWHISMPCSSSESSLLLPKLIGLYAGIFRGFLMVDDVRSWCFLQCAVFCYLWSTVWSVYLRR